MKLKHFALFALLSPVFLASCATGVPKDLTPPSSSEATAVDPSSIQGAKVLFVGNSFTYWNNIPGIAERIGKSLGMGIECESVTKGSQKLIDTANPENEVGAALEAALTSKKYTHIVLQEQSTTPLKNYATYVEAVKKIKKRIGETQESPEVYLYSTWAYTSMCEGGETIPACEKRLREATFECAVDTGLKVTYVGKAFSEAYDKYEDKSFLYCGDNKHPSYAGSFLSAATHIASMFKVDVRENAFYGTPGVILDAKEECVIDPAIASELEEIAYEVGMN
ncbi:MAG: DUF4886 domain-containing protein [Candidatus Enteromonas sp.]